MAVANGSRGDGLWFGRRTWRLQEKGCNGWSGLVAFYVKQFMGRCRGELLTPALCNGPFSRSSVYCQRRPSTTIFI
jgi:hypothetical protein